MDVQADVRVGNGYVRTLSCLLTELINDSVLDFISDELRVAELLRENDRVNGEGRFQIQVFRPVHRFDTLVDIIGRKCLEMFDWF